MFFRIKTPHIVAIAIVITIAAWMLTGEVTIGGQTNGESKSIREREEKRSSELFRVNYVVVQPEKWDRELVIRGHTKASATIPVRTQVNGILMERLVNKGNSVEKNQIVCKIDIGTRAAQLTRDEAQFARAQADYDANLKLAGKGVVSENRLKALKASLDAASAEVAQAKLNLARSDVRANAEGVVIDPVAQVGDILNVGDVCITLIQSNPMKFSGRIPERDIDGVHVGAKASIELIDGQSLAGIVRYVSPSADSSTRTFLVEIDIPNPDGTIRDGITAMARVALLSVEAYRLSPSWITLSDKGEIGVRVIDDRSTVHFVELNLITQSRTDLWATGLQPGTRVITLGQEYVIAGEKVEPVIAVAPTSANSMGIQQ